MKRIITAALTAWQHSKNRKPLILKGARQVGKTFILKEFAARSYPNYHYLNFEKQPKLASLFDGDLDPSRILQSLGLHLQTTIDPYRDLIIFDEIQACPNALTSLKYFCEDEPHVHICAAGSLLGAYLTPVSYPVGKVDHLNLYPMSFLEFLMAMGDEQYVAFLQTLNNDAIIPSVAHDHLWQRWKHYLITGGLPEVVKIYCELQPDLFSAFGAVRAKQQDLIEDYFSDIAKHSGKINAMHINRIWRNIPEQLAKTQDSSAKKFKFKGAVPGIDRYQKLSDALDWLVSAGLVIKTHVINSAELPLKAYIKENHFKLFLFDVGILGAMSEIQPQTLLDYQYGTYKGFVAENYIAQAFTFSSSASLYSWAENMAEIEFVRDIHGNAIPIEVKSGWVTQAKSLSVFTQKYHPSYRVIMSAQPFAINHQTHLQKIPLYLAELWPLRDCNSASGSGSANDRDSSKKSFLA